MEKYTVDIDKVLDDFEESEALVAEQCQSADSSLDESNNLSHRCDGKAVLCTALSEDNVFCSSSCSNSTNSASHSTRTNFEELNSTDSELTSSVRTTVFQQACADPNLHSWNYEIVYKPFQCPCNFQDGLSPCLNNNNNNNNNNNGSDVDKINGKCSYSDSMKDSVNGAITTHSTADKALCVSQQILYRVSGNSPKHLDTLFSSGSLELVNNEKEPETVFTNITETIYSDRNVSTEHFNCYKKDHASDDSTGSLACASANDAEDVNVDTSPNLPPIHPKHLSESMQISGENSKFNVLDERQNVKSTSDVTGLVGQSTSKSLKFDSSNVLPNEKEACEKTDTSHVNVVSFSMEAEEPQISLEDMNEYLNDVVSGYQVQDEDSGVSSQEDVNGNNLSIDLLNSEVRSLEAFCPVSAEAKFETPEVTEKCYVSGSSQSDVGTTVERNQMTSVQCNEFHNSSAEKENSSSECDEEALTDEPKLGANNNKQIERSNIESTSTVVREESNEILLRSKLPPCSPLSANENLTLSEPDTSSGNETSLNNYSIDAQAIDTVQVKSLPAQNGISCASQTGTTGDNMKTDIPAMKLLFFPSDGTFCSVPSDQILTPDCKESSNDVTKQNYNSNFDKDCESDALSVPENQTCPSRLQRPTTLNLPCRSVGTANIVTSYIDSALPPSAVEVSLSQAVSDATDAENPSHEILLSKIGKIKPFWIPDSSAVNCMHCGIKFTVIKRRHHCRACGKVLCSRCCNQKARLPYLLNKEDRVCQQCIEILAFNQAEREKEEELEKGESPISSSCGSSPSFSPTSTNFQQKGCWRPHPNNPDDYCSTISPLQQVQELANRPPPTVMVPVGVLKRGNKPRGVPKQVIFSDGIRPGGDLTDLTESVDTAHVYHRRGRRSVDKSSASSDASPVGSSSVPLEASVNRVPSRKSQYKRIVVSDSEGPLPPVLLSNDSAGEENFDLCMLLSKLQDEESGPVVFAVTKNLHILTKITKLDCCFGKECWCFTSHGLCTVGQDEVVLILERFRDEDMLPRDAFTVFSKIYDNASKGATVGELGHLIFPDGIFGSWEHRGFLFVRPTFQCLNKLILPNKPYLFALLIQKWEVPWAKVFPLRLMLRLGAECRYYPCSLVSIRFRKPLYFEIGQTIMNVLADLRNFQFTIPFVPGLVVHMEEKKTCVNIPRNRYEKLMKVLNSNNVEHVLSLGSNFSTEADSHLVCMQKDEGDYQTRAINIEHTTRRVTGASFIVFSGALKSTTGLSAKFSIVEDGLLVEIPQETMGELHCALRDMRDLIIKCGQVKATEPEEVVIVQWTPEDKKINIGVTSPIDKRSLEGTSSLRIHTSTDYAGDNYLIRWTEVFFLETDKSINSRRTDAIDPCRIAETVAQAFCMSLIPYLDALADAEMTKIGLRITLDTERDMVEYDVGSLGQNLPSMYMNALDSSLIPVLSRIAVAHQEEPVALELIFYILIK